MRRHRLCVCCRECGKAASLDRKYVFCRFFFSGRLCFRGIRFRFRNVFCLFRLTGQGEGVEILATESNGSSTVRKALLCREFFRIEFLLIYRGLDTRQMVQMGRRGRFFTDSCSGCSGFAGKTVNDVCAIMDFYFNENHHRRRRWPIPGAIRNE